MSPVDSDHRSPAPSQNLAEDSRRVANDLREMYDTIRRDNVIGQIYDQNPYAVIAAAAGIGYVLGGGLFTPFTRRIVRVGMKALVVPMAASQFRGLTGGQGSDFNGGGSSNTPF